MFNATINSLALLKVNYDRLGRDYLENFLPMVAEAIRSSHNDVISLPELQAELQEHFGLSLPQSTVRTILARAKKRGYVVLEHGAYYRNMDELNKLGFRDVRRRVVEEHDFLIREFVEFCSRQFEFTLSPEDAVAALQSYLEEHQLLVVSAVTHGTVIPPSGKSVRNSRFLVGSFVRHLQETSSAALDYLETIVKGHMLANAIFLPEPANASRNFLSNPHPNRDRRVPTPKTNLHRRRPVRITSKST